MLFSGIGRIAAVIASVASLAQASSSSKPAGPVSIHLLPPASSQFTEPKEVSWNEATSILSHINGVSQMMRGSGLLVDDFQTDFTSILDDQRVLAVSGGGVFGQPSASMLVLVKGVSAGRYCWNGSVVLGLHGRMVFYKELMILFNSKDDISVSPAFVISSNENTSSRKLSRYINDFSEVIASSRSGSRANIITLSSESQMLALEGAARITLGKKAATVTTPSTTSKDLVRTIDEITKSAYSETKTKFVEMFGELGTVFKEHNEYDRLFMVEMEIFSSLMEALRIQNMHLLKRSAGHLPDFMAVTLTHAQDLFIHHGSSSAQYQNGAKILKKVLADAAAAFQSIYTDGVVEIIVSPPSVHLDGDQPNLLRRVASVDPSCPQSVSDCNSVFNSCSNHGACASMVNPRNLNQTCFFCQCFRNNTDDAGKAIPGSGKQSVIWAGPTCAQQDISAEFHLFFWTGIILFVTTVFVIGLLASLDTDETESQKAGAGKHYKEE
ncbi:hypothetical protein HDU76_008637 [Blyttiomyces sp. JEL0837]|nr:hypothetical protein HDU76_008637 [Blyttiomyces sp. JEL0837]